MLAPIRPSPTIPSCMTESPLKCIRCSMAAADHELCRFDHMGGGKTKMLAGSLDRRRHAERVHANDRAGGTRVMMRCHRIVTQEPLPQHIGRWRCVHRCAGMPGFRPLHAIDCQHAYRIAGAFARILVQRGISLACGSERRQKQYHVMETKPCALLLAFVRSHWRNLVALGYARPYATEGIKDIRYRPTYAPPSAKRHHVEERCRTGHTMRPPR